jgi:hypothetical protein
MKISLLHTVVFNFIKFYVFIFLYGLLGPYESLKVFGYSSLFTVVAFVVYTIAMVKINLKIISVLFLFTLTLTITGYLELKLNIFNNILEGSFMLLYSPGFWSAYGEHFYRSIFGFKDATFLVIFTVNFCLYTSLYMLSQSTWSFLRKRVTALKKKES